MSYTVERGVPDKLFDRPDKLINFWAPIKTKKNEFAGVMGIQFPENVFGRLQNPLSIEEPYPATYMGVFEH